MCIRMLYVRECACVCRDSINASMSVHVCMSAQEHVYMCVRCCACVCECACVGVKECYACVCMCV